MAKIVIDANVIISAAFGGKPLETVAWATEDDEVYLSEGVERELRGVLSGLSKKRSKDQMAFLEEKIMQTSTGIIDYYLKCCIEGGFSKTTIT